MLTIYAPTNNLKSKAWEVFSGVLKSWPKQTNCLDNSKATTACLLYTSDAADE